MNLLREPQPPDRGPGRIIMLNGASSSGKSTLATLLRRASPRRTSSPGAPPRRTSSPGAPPRRTSPPGASRHRRIWACHRPSCISADLVDRSRKVRRGISPAF
ncbi:phosphotransferase-like protein [Nonomuraea sp. LPB2021202275-12-8]|uniref:phosphotransferase-like protein n=1 Tax=Nonomuraea sp. LPB2021202275-12-8 TaxID=3120159 RepID=UPI003FA59773